MFSQERHAFLFKIVVSFIALSVLLGLSASAQVAIAFFSGALVGVIPQLFFFSLVFGGGESLSASLIALRRIYIALSVKILASIAGFALVFSFLEPPNPSLVFVGFVFVLILQTCLLHLSVGGFKKLYQVA